MTKLLSIVKTGLTSNQIKWIALIFMTIDHLGAFGFEIPLFAAHMTLLRCLGRIAAPLFLYMIAESARYTRGKPRFILRLYLAGMSVGLFTAVTNYSLGSTVGFFAPGNIIFTFFYTVLYIYLLETILLAMKAKDSKRIIVCVLALAASWIPQLLFDWMSVFDRMNIINLADWQLRNVVLFEDLTHSFIPSPLQVEYSLMFVFMGIVLYFAKTKKKQCTAFICFCILCYCIGSAFQNHFPFNDFFDRRQYWMILALPFMLLYNSKRGKEQKLFFYSYYPLHRYLISVMQAIIT